MVPGKNRSPTESGTKKVFRQIFPPKENDVLDIIQSDKFKAFVMTDATTPQGRNAIAKYFGVNEEWGNVKSKATPNEQYYQLLYLVKTKSKKDTLWISFIEGLHRHAAMVMSLLCSSFDLKNNYINCGSLSMKDFRRANIKHIQMNEHTPSEQLNDIMEKDFLDIYCSGLCAKEDKSNKH